MNRRSYAGKNNPMYGKKSAFRGKHHTDEAKKKIGKANSSENNAFWKGNDVGYSQLHIWVRNHLPQPELCQLCNKKPSVELANIIGVYNRDFKNWAYYCCKCHRVYDIKMKVELRTKIFRTFPR